MILYLDTSALVKRYIREKDSDLVTTWVDHAELVGTALITRVGMASTLRRAVKANRLPPESVQLALDEFHDDWSCFLHIPVDEALTLRADALACEYALRSVTAIHLACALTWKEMLKFPVVLATFDPELREAAQKSGLEVLPE